MGMITETKHFLLEKPRETGVMAAGKAVVRGVQAGYYRLLLTCARFDKSVLKAQEKKYKVAVCAIFKDEAVHGVPGVWEYSNFGAGIAGAALECLAVEWLHAAAAGMTGGFVWSPFVLAPCLFISLALFFINGNRSVREEVRRRVHF